MDFDCWDWKAVQDDQSGPGEETTLTITGTCGKFPKDGYRLQLVPRPGGINPWIPFFDLVVHEPDGPSAEVLSDEPVEHTMTVRRGDPYEEVDIFYDGQQRWSVEVEHLQ